MPHNFLATEVEPPTLKLRLVLDAGPDEGAISFLGVDATSLNIENPDDDAGSGASATTSAYSPQMNQGRNLCWCSYYQ